MVRDSTGQTEQERDIQAVRDGVDDRELDVSKEVTVGE